MANTYPITFANKALLSKVKIGNDVYYVKDADLRAIIAQFGNAADQSVAASIAENGTGLTTSAQVYDFVSQKTADLEGAMHFKGVAASLPATAEDGDVYVVGTKEYVWSGGEEGSFKEIGDEGLWVPNTRMIAGIDLVDNITVDELKNALSLKALAYAATASVTVEDYATSITGASYTPAGDVTATIGAASTAATLTTADYTPAGNVTGTVSLADNEDGYQVHGTNAPSAVSVTPNTETVLKSVQTAAVLPSFTEGEFTPGSFTKGSAVTAATEGLVAAMDSTDTEMLVFTAAATDSVMDYDATFVAPTKTADTFNAGSAAVFDTQTVMTGVASATAAAQVFTGGKVGATFSGNASGDAISANFAGTKVTDFQITGVTYDKTTVSDLAFAGTTATITPTLNKGNKTITVTPDVV